MPFVRAGEMIRPGLELPPCWYQNLAESASISAGAGPGYGWSRVRTMVRPSHHKAASGNRAGRRSRANGWAQLAIIDPFDFAIERRRRFWRRSLMCVGQFVPDFSLFFCWSSKQRYSGQGELVREDRWTRTRSEIEQLTSCRGIGATSVNSSKVLEEAS